MKNAFLFLLFALPLLQSCGGHEHHEGKSPEVLLDNGNRWLANPETTQGITHMQAILTKYVDKTETSADRKALAKELETSLQKIFKLCTMKGDGHEQLHNYLLPMKDLFTKIESGTSPESKAALTQLEQHLAVYDSYFQ